MSIYKTTWYNLCIMYVEEYKKINQYTLKDILESKNIFDIQGQPILIVYSSNISKQELIDFFNLSFKYISKIALEKNSKYYIVCDKYKKEVIEPFHQYENVSENMNTEDIINFIIKND